MKEEEIRPQSLEFENYALYAEDVSALLKHKKAFSEVPCPACGSENYRHIYDKNGFDIVSCSRCETAFVNPRPLFEHLADHYKSSKSIKHWNDKLFPASEESRRKHIFRPRAERVVELTRAHKPDARSIMDIGAGFGTFCEEIKNLGVFDTIIAVEPSHNLAET